MYNHKYINYSNLKRFVFDVFKKIGLEKFSNHAVTNGICEASLRGVDSHGIRLLPHYINSALYGRKNPNPKFKFKKIYPTIGKLDANHAFGLAAGKKAIDYGMKIAHKYGVGIVTVINSTHPGAMASITLQAARKNYICWGFTHADSLLQSYNGKRSYFGTNPICVSVPRINEEPYCLDMATSKISWNKLLSFKDKKKNLNENLASDKNGLITNDPFLASSLIPIGEYKGFGLASLIEILCGVYTGMNYGRKIKPMYTSPINKKRKLGQFYMIMKIDGAISKKIFLKEMSKFSKSVRKEPAKKNKRVLLPNDPEIAVSRKRKKTGIPLDKKVYEDLLNISKKYSINLKIKK